MAIIDTFKANTTSVDVPACHPSFTGVPNNFVYSSPGLLI
jgi:hypothetical protein